MGSVSLPLALRCHFCGAREEDLIRNADRLGCIISRLDVIFIEVVALEELLDAVSAKLCLALLDSLRILPLLVIDMVRIEVVHVNVGHIIRRHCSISERCPVKVTEPRMGLQLRCSILVANAVVRLALEALVDKISGLLVPAIWDAEFLDLDLAREYCVPYLLPGLAFVWTFSHHTLVPNNPHCKVIRSQPVILTAHDLGSHVPGRSTRLTCVVGRIDARDTKISQA